MTRKLTDEEFKAKVYRLVGDEYDVVSPYLGKNKPVTMLHKVCNKTFSVNPASFYKGSRCKNCSEYYKTTDEFKKEVKDLVGSEYTVLGEYLSSHTKISIKHNKCGTTFSVEPSQFLAGSRCPTCAHMGRRLTPESFQKWFDDETKGKYTLLTPYVKSAIKVKVRHNTCGHEYEVTPNNFKRGKRCPYCGNERKRKTNSTFAKQVHDLSKGKLELASKYTGVNDFVLIKCLKHNISFSMTPTGFIRSETERCPICKAEASNYSYTLSSPVLYLYSFLIKRGVTVQMERAFPDVKNIQVLPYDFFLPEYNLLIEYDGREHFESSSRFGGKKRLDLTRSNDNIKNLSAKVLGMHLIRIPYTELNFVKVIDDYINGTLPKDCPYIIC
jgi:DNA-directed RNA polymerase subunit RPC12/RpoP